jgi:hypothetical protein
MHSKILILQFRKLESLRLSGGCSWQGPHASSQDGGKEEEQMDQCGREKKEPNSWATNVFPQ